MSMEQPVKTSNDLTYGEQVIFKFQNPKYKF